MREKLKVCDADSKAYLNRFERLLMDLTRHELDEHAEFLDHSSFRLKSCHVPRRNFPGTLRAPPANRGSPPLPSQSPIGRGGLGAGESRDLPPWPFGLTTAHMTAESVFWNRFSVNPVG